MLTFIILLNMHVRITTCINQKPIVSGDVVQRGDVLADGPSTERAC